MLIISSFWLHATLVSHSKFLPAGGLDYIGGAIVTVWLKNYFNPHQAAVISTFIILIMTLLIQAYIWITICVSISLVY